MPHDFSLHSGERQTATLYEEVRADHRYRYEWADQRLPKAGSGLDLFCGTGYGTRRLVRHGRRLIGIDGSKEATAFAMTHFGGLGAEFVAVKWPFPIRPRCADFIVSLESIEHVADGVAMFKTMAEALKPGGHIIYSTPNGDALPLAAFRPFHHRHYSLAETLALATDAGLELVGWAGQNVYRPGPSGLLSDTAMQLHPETPGQFTIVHARRPAPGA